MDESSLLDVLCNMQDGGCDELVIRRFDIDMSKAVP